jgi:hypothetical protein
MKIPEGFTMSDQTEILTPLDHCQAKKAELERYISAMIPAMYEVHKQLGIDMSKFAAMMQSEVYRMVSSYVPNPPIEDATIWYRWAGLQAFNYSSIYISIMKSEDPK